MEFSEMKESKSIKLKMVRDTGFEPVTPSVSGRCSTTELTAQILFLASTREARLGVVVDAIPFLSKKARNPKIPRL